MNNIWEEISIYIGKKAQNKLHRYVRGNIDLLKVRCGIYRTNYCYACHWIILSYKTLFIYWMLLWVLTYIYPIQVFGISLTRFNEFKAFWTCYFTSPLEKYVYYFWKVRGIIDGFNESRRHISFGMKRIVDVSKSYTQCITNP